MNKKKQGPFAYKSKNSSKKSYKYNTTKLVLSVVFVTLFFSALGTAIGYHYLIKPQTADQAQLSNELETMELQYNLLNKKFAQTQKVLEDLEERDDNIYRSFFELQPISEDLRKAGFGGTNRYEKFEDLSYADLVTETSRNLDILSKQLVVQSKSLDEVLEAAKNKEKLFKHIPAIQPIANKELKRVASGYGMRLHPILKVGKMHWGLDFSAPIGTPIYATADATVDFAGSAGGYGNVVILKHGYGYETYYAHMSKINTRKGKSVKRGDVIGFVGNTGLSSGPHLHYEVHKDGEKVDPIAFLTDGISPDEFKVLYEKSQKMTVSLD
ncbi:peptidoglycan DD-metalloendopeptidase family protein [Flavobacteriaceae bacterium Ap0902]|nr:peptidoglycan DD-metalloendopeptidase family protein [Flavobacteriaceae bacterium Ap0902]